MYYFVLVKNSMQTESANGPFVLVTLRHVQNIHMFKIVKPFFISFHIQYTPKLIKRTINVVKCFFELFFSYSNFNNGEWCVREFKRWRYFAVFLFCSVRNFFITKRNFNWYVFEFPFWKVQKTYVIQNKEN